MSALPTLVKKDEELIESIRKDEKWAINQLYLKHLKNVLRHLQNKGCSESEAQEHFNDAFVIFVNRVNDEYFLNYVGSLLPWFKKTSSNIFFKSLKGNKEVLPSPIEVFEKNELEKLVAKEQKQELLIKIKVSMSKMTETCKSIIELSILSTPRFSAAEIAEMLGYKSAATTDVTKSRCLKQLKKYFNSNYERSN